MSIGPPCIFLLGGNTKDVQPISMLLRSGDALILGGEARLKYHGVPKVFVNAHDGGAPAHLRVNQENLQYIETLTLHTHQCPLFLHCRSGSYIDKHDNPCCCDNIDPVEIQRTLKVLNCARININLRQVYYRVSKSEEETQKQNDEIRKLHLKDLPEDVLRLVIDFSDRNHSFIATNRYFYNMKRQWYMNLNKYMNYFKF